MESPERDTVSKSRYSPYSRFADWSRLHGTTFLIKDIRGNLGEPVSRLTPLGWSCTGPVTGLKHGSFQTRFAHTEIRNKAYFVRKNTDTDQISRLLRGLWEIESYGTLPNRPVISPEEQCALEKVEKSLKYVDGRYQVGIPWKEDNPVLPDNYEMALRRLINTEKRLLKSPEVADVYTNNIRQYLEKGYIRKIHPIESKQ